MLLTLTCTTPPATDLGFLLHKNPGRVQSFELNFGQAHVFYPQATPERCTAALVLDVDPVHLVRGRKDVVEQYVTDRPYVASSFMSVALSQVFGTALSGVCKQRPERAAAALPYEARLAVLPCRGGEPLIRKLFEPLGYTLTVQPHLLDQHFAQWGPSEYFTITLTNTCRLSDLLSHLYVLIPVLDAEKHYWMSDDEVTKLLRHGEGWLAAHPERDTITRRYLMRRRLIRAALAQLTDEDNPDPDGSEAQHAEEEAQVEQRVSLHEQRLGAVTAVLKAAHAKRVLDLGCGEGRLLEVLLADRAFTEIVGMDVSIQSLKRAGERLRLDQLPPMQRQRIQLIQGALTYRDQRLAGFDAAALVEVIEHLDPPRLAALQRVVFEFARPGLVVITTPNREYNAKFETLPAGRLRHKDHRFEWTRAEFQGWAEAVAQRFEYEVRFLPVGPEDAALGAPSQMGVFSRADRGGSATP